MFSVRAKSGSNSSLMTEESPDITRRTRGGTYILKVEPSISVTSVSHVLCIISLFESEALMVDLVVGLAICFLA